MRKERLGQEQRPGHSYSFPSCQPTGFQATEPEASFRGANPRGGPGHAPTQVSPAPDQEESGWRQSPVEFQSLDLPTETTGESNARVPASCSGC